MKINLKEDIGGVISPLGATFFVPFGRTLTVDVETHYWMKNNPSVEIEFDSPDEQERAGELCRLSALNPLGALAAPQTLNPNATILVDGTSVKVPVLVVNPVGLFAEHQPAHVFEKPNVSYVLDEELLTQVVEKVLAAQRAPKDEAPPQKVKKAGSVTQDEL